MALKDPKIRRVCPFAAQTCTKKVGCDVFARAMVRVDNADDKLRALNCVRRGVHLFADEVKAGEMHVYLHSDEKRERYARGVRTQLHTTRRRGLQSPLPEPFGAAAAAAGVGE